MDDQAREESRAKKRAYAANARARQTEEDRNKRRAKDAARKASARGAEDETASKKRRAEDAARKASARGAEDHARRVKDAARKASARGGEDEDERDARLQKQRRLSAKANASKAVRQPANTEHMDAGAFHGFTRADALERPLEFWRSAAFSVELGPRIAFYIIL